MKEPAKHLKNDNFSEYIGIQRVLCKDGSWTAKLTVGDIHLNGLGIAQGGAIFTLADYAFALAANTAGRTTTGLQTNINYLSPARCGDILIAHPREISRRKTISVYEIEIRNEETGQLIALFTGTGYRIK